MKVKSESEVAQSCPTPSNRMDCSLPGSSIHGIFQATVLEWGAIAFSQCDTSSYTNIYTLWSFWEKQNQSHALKKIVDLTGICEKQEE